MYDCNREWKPVVKYLGRYLGFRLSVTSDRVQSITFEKLMVENIDFGFGMVFLSSVQGDIYVFPVWTAAILCSDFR